MEDCMRLCMRKLALWRTTTFKPLMTHAELEPIMVTMGFVGLPPFQETPGLGWKEYVYTAWWQPKPFSSLSSTAAEPPSPTDPSLDRSCRTPGSTGSTLTLTVPSSTPLTFIFRCGIFPISSISGDYLFNVITIDTESGGVWKMKVYLCTGRGH
ncbi:hypothetical protein ERO13_A13G064166v2 [Gossypium hirsutum]|nr:hypothetical protein ERO13_A13G064166v2 [Gossypium hirsutum]TYG85635.1 hypothetical protein ES288_A13G070900v1 [Gossypium darwinii]